MNISTKLNDEQIDPNKPSKGYEWWYFDALSADNEWGFVVIFYQGNPFSPKYIHSENGMPSKFPAISISVYNRGKAEYYSFLEYGENRFNWDEDEQTGSIGSNFFKRTKVDGNLGYELLLVQTLESGHSLNANLKFTSKALSEGLLEDQSEKEKHFWNLLQPKAKVNGSIKLKGKAHDRNIIFTGAGYHDHNTGYEPMKDSFKDWYWGRFHFKDSTLIYYVMNGLDGNEQHEAWLISNDGQKVMEKFSSIKLDAYEKSLFGLNVARKIELFSGSSKVAIQQRKPIDNGPFYQRYLSDVVMIQEGKTQASTGISEFIEPEKIYDEKYWWMVRMRLRFMNEKPHWVQKSKMFYEWTW
tara:strand:+ start:26845 stop:27909 length:1065 start_codon:yes stop_codon:yes gene_type:complete